MTYINDNNNMMKRKVSNKKNCSILYCVYLAVIRESQQLFLKKQNICNISIQKLSHQSTQTISIYISSSHSTKLSKYRHFPKVDENKMTQGIVKQRMDKDKPMRQCQYKYIEMNITLQIHQFQLQNSVKSHILFHIPLSVKMPVLNKEFRKK